MDFLAFWKRREGGESALRSSAATWVELWLAPSHPTLQRFFNLTAPCGNSMLIRLEERGFIRRVAGKARAIEIIVRPE